MSVVTGDRVHSDQCECQMCTFGGGGSPTFKDEERSEYSREYDRLFEENKGGLHGDMCMCSFCMKYG